MFSRLKCFVTGHRWVIKRRFLDMRAQWWIIEHCTRCRKEEFLYDGFKGTGGEFFSDL